MSDYLTDDEQLAKVRTWWDENGTSLIVGLVLVVAGAIGWRWYGDYRDETIATASDLYQRFLIASPEERGGLLESLTDARGGTAYPTLALLHMADAAALAEDYEAAATHLQNAVSAAPETVLADLARLRLARALHQLDRTQAALDILGAIRSEGFRSHVAELKGDIHVARGERALAHEAYTAALAAVAQGDRRPMLQMKADDTRDAAEVAAARAPGADPVTAPDA